MLDLSLTSIFTHLPPAFRILFFMSQISHAAIMFVARSRILGLTRACLEDDRLKAYSSFAAVLKTRDVLIKSASEAVSEIAKSIDRYVGRN